jgi:peptide/nickel transport system permease protein
MSAVAVEGATRSEPAPRTARRVLGAIGASYVVRRLAKAVVTIIFVTTLIFFLIRLLPGSPVEVFINQQVGLYGYSYEDARSQAAAIYGFDPDTPLVQQYIEYVGNLARGDLGQSLLSPGVPVTSLIRRFLPWTLFSVGTGLALAFVIGVAGGMLMAYRRGSAVDHALSAVGSLLHSVPNYLFALMIVVFLGVRLGWLPITDMRGTLSSGQRVDWSLGFVKDALYHAALPIATYVLTGLGSWMLLMKSSTIAALDDDYVTVARARGLSERRIATAYVGRNAILPLFAQLTIAIGFVVGGSYLVEPIFLYEGVGYLLFKALQGRDYPLMQGIFLMITVSVVIANLAADLLYGRLDPRIRAGSRRE